MELTILNGGNGLLGGNSWLWSRNSHHQVHLVADAHVEPAAALLPLLHHAPVPVPDTSHLQVAPSYRLPVGVVWCSGLYPLPHIVQVLAHVGHQPGAVSVEA